MNKNYFDNKTYDNSTVTNQVSGLKGRVKSRLRLKKSRERSEKHESEQRNSEYPAIISINWESSNSLEKKVKKFNSTAESKADTMRDSSNIFKINRSKLRESRKVRS